MKNKPFWFNIISQWKEMGYGQYGVSFPFLVGSISTLESCSIDEDFVRKVFEEIQKYPVDGYYCEVRWCGNIDEPVASMKPLSDLKIVSIKATLSNESQVSVGFTTDLMNMFHLDCETANECIEKLILRTSETVCNGNFSKNSGAFTPFTESDKAFIEKVYQLSAT